MSIVTEMLGWVLRATAEVVTKQMQSVSKFISRQQLCRNLLLFLLILE